MQRPRKPSTFDNRNIFAMVGLQSACETVKGDEAGDTSKKITEIKILMYRLGAAESTKDFKHGLVKVRLMF